MTRHITVIPYVVGNFEVADWSRGGERRFERIQLLPSDPIDLEIGDNDNLRYAVGNQLRDIVIDAAEVGMNSDVNLLLEEDFDSPPVKIVRDQDIPNAVEGSYFQVVGINGTPLSFAGRERLFKSAPPELKYDNTKYFEPDKESMLKVRGKDASCGFQYIYQTFGKKAGYKKFAKDFKSIKDWATKKPPMFNAWLKQNQDEFNVEKLNLNKNQKGITELKSFEEEFFAVDVLQLEEDKWTEEEIENSLSVLDIIRWCMWARVSCNVIDQLGDFYLSYHENMVSHPYCDRPNHNNRNITMKVADHHAYFVDDKYVKRSATNTYSKWNQQDFEDIGEVWKKDEFKDTVAPPEPPKDWSLEAIDKYDEAMDEWREDNAPEVWFAPYFKARKAIQLGDITGNDIAGCEAEEFEDKLFELGTQIYKGNPPPLPTEFLKDENKSYYLGCSNLNGLISILANQYNVLPKTMNGQTAHGIDRATYGKTKLFSRRCMPLKDMPSNQEIEAIQKTFPQLSLKQIPTYTQVAKEIFKKHYWRGEIYSMMNTNTRRSFMDGEIKPDNRILKETVSCDAVSIDLVRAYTSAMRDMDVSWNVYDGINQFKRYAGYFNPDLFYLVEEIGSGYPLRGGDGLKLYHGCFLRHLLGKGLVIIKWVISPIKKLPNDYFTKFVEECEDQDLFESKYLVNSFIGGLKCPNKITSYKFHTTRSETTKARAFYTGGIISTLDRNTEHNREYRWEDDKPIHLISHPCKEFNIQTGQPIRLQIMDKINEMIWKLYHTYKVCLNFRGLKNTRLAMVRTDALYFERQTPDKFLNQVCELCPYECQVEKDILQDDWVCKDYHKPNSVFLNSNRWRDVVSVRKKWSKDIGGKLLFNLINIHGGGLVQGEGGVGKSELMIKIGETFDHNRIRYKWKKAILKSQDDPLWFQKLEEWRDDNPCFCIKLAPTNKATNRIKGKTLHRGLGVPVMSLETKDDQVSYFETIIARLQGDGFKNPCFDYVLVDEISMIDGYMWSLLHSIKQRIPRIKFILCGDMERQLPPVGQERRDFRSAYLIKELGNFFKLNLNYNFRSKSSTNLLWTKWSLIPECFKVRRVCPETVRNLSYTNKTRKEVINKWQDKLMICDPIVLSWQQFYETKPTTDHQEGQTDKLVVMTGLKYIATKSVKSLEVGNNETFVIKLCGAGVIELYGEHTSIELTYQEFYELFYSAFCITIHKSQGDTYDDEYTIHDWAKISEDTPFKRKLRYVAQSRSKDDVIPSRKIYYK
jgi:hypothetical protein